MKNRQKFMNIAMLTIGTVALTACGARSQNHQGNGQRSGQRPSATAMIAEMDADKDGKLSETEVKGPLADDFPKIDTDKDGFITEEELKNAPKPKGPPPRGER